MVLHHSLWFLFNPGIQHGWWNNYAFWLAEISKIFYKTECMLALLLGRNVPTMFLFFVDHKFLWKDHSVKLFWNLSSLKPLHHLKGSLAWIFLIYPFAKCLGFFLCWSDIENDPMGKLKILLNVNSTWINIGFYHSNFNFYVEWKWKTTATGNYLTIEI